MKRAKSLYSRLQDLRTGAIALLLWFLLCVSPASAAFEETGEGARPVAMAGAFTAISDDAHAIHYNPAGLAQLRRGELTADYGKLFLGLKDNSSIGNGFVGAALPLQQGRLGTVGFGWDSLSLDQTYKEDTFSLAYGKEVLTDGFFVGSTAKILKRSFGSDAYTQADPLFQNNGYNTQNFAFDFGTLYRPGPAFSFALAFKNVNQPDIAIAGGEKLPLEFHGGFGYHQRQLVFDAEMSRKDSDTNVSLGLEKWLLKTVSLLTGFSVGSREKREISAGMGYKGANFELNYAFVFPLAGIESTGGSHRFGVAIRFGKAPEKSPWEFEDEDKAVERLLEERAARIDSLERELENLRDQNRDGKLESDWVRKQIEKLQDQLRNRETQELQTLKTQLMESKTEEARTKQKLQQLEDKIHRLAAPRPLEPPARTEAAPATKAVPSSYTVKEGDTLKSIAHDLYNDESKWVQIYELNSDRIERGGSIRSGQVLILPKSNNP